STNIAVVAAVLHQEAPRLRSVNPALDPRLDEIVQRCLRKKPEDRFQSIEEVKQLLAQCRAPERAVLLRAPWRRNTWTGWLLAAAVLTIACAAAWIGGSYFATPESETAPVLTRLVSN